MTREEVLERVNAIFREVFEDDTIVVQDETTAADIEDWDSYEHINLINAIEQEFEMKFTMGQVVGMENVGELIDILMEQT